MKFFPLRPTHSCLHIVLVATMLAIVSGISSAYFAPPLAAQCHAARCDRSAVAMSSPDELGMLQAMSDSFWKQKRARMKADLAAQLLELDEFEAREKALTQVGGGVPQLGASADVAALQAELEAERARSAALEAQLEKTAIEAELNLQKVASFWINKVEEAKGALPAATAAPAIASSAAAEPAAAEPAAADLVSGVPKEYLEPDLTLRELRARLLAKGLSTLGLKSELRARLEANMLLDRQQFKSWDSEALVWK